jgi:hypothetical protein
MGRTQDSTDMRLAAANQRLIRKFVYVVLIIATAYTASIFFPSLASVVAAWTAESVPSVMSLKTAVPQTGPHPFLFFGVIVPILPLLALYLSWNSDVQLRFALGSNKSGRGRVENLIILYAIFLPITMALLAFGYYSPINVVSTTNTFGSKLLHLMLHNELGLLLIGGPLVAAAVICLTAFLWCLYLPINGMMQSFNTNTGE